MTASATTSPQPARASLGWAALRLQSDQELSELVRDGYEQAFDAIVERHRGPLLRYSATLVGTERAEDVVQQAFEKALHHLRHDERELALRAWLYSVCHNLSINHLQRKGSDYEQLDENYDGVPQPPDVVERGQNLRQVLKQVRGLPDRQRSALMLSAVGGMSYDQIADDMHVTPAVVRQLLYRARITLRNALGAAVPAPVIRLWLAGAGPDHSQIAELVAGGGAGAGMVKAGAAVMAASVVATGAGVTVSHRAHTTSSPTVSHHSAPRAGASASGTVPGLAADRHASEPGDRQGSSGTGHGRDDSGGGGGSGSGEDGPGGGGGRHGGEGESGHGGSGPGGGGDLESQSGDGHSGHGGGGGEQPEGGSGEGPGGGSESGSGNSGPGGGSGEGHSGSGESEGSEGGTNGGGGGPEPGGGPDDGGGHH